MKISISQGFVSGEDELIYTGTLSQSQPTPGTLELTGSTDVRDYVAAIGTVFYKNSKTNPTLGVRKITISLNDVDYLPATGHFYRFVPKVGMTWTSARDQAAITEYYGLKGYLATIGSDVENNFIREKTTGEGWIGASDAAVEEDWRWVTGPEGLMNGGNGLSFWKGSGYKAKINNSSGVYGPVKDPFGNPYYHNWNKWDSSTGDECTYEPNNWVSVNNVAFCGANNVPGEDYAHITFPSGETINSRKWNDYPNNGNSTGYLIEFGGMEDVVLDLTATLELQVNTMFFYKTGIQPAVCEGTTVKLNQPDLNIIPASYAWIPDETLSATDIANPIATPKFPSSTYTVTGTRGTCPSVTVSYTVPVNPKPISLLKTEYNICKGEKITLDPGVQKSFIWSTGYTSQTIDVETSADYSVTLTTDKDCTAPPFTAKVIVHEFSTIDLSNVQKLICGDTKTTVNFIPALATEYSLLSIDGNVQISNKLDVTVPAFGVYPMIYKAAIYSGCPKEEPFNLSFYKNPAGMLVVKGQAEGQKCFGYNLDAVFTPEGDLTGASYEWNFGGEVIEKGIGIKTLVVPLGISLIKRDLKLTVSQDGCPASFTEKDILVIPNLSLTVDKDIGCEPLPVIFTANSEGSVKYVWNFGDNILVDGSTPDQKHTYQNAGFYDVYLKVTTGDDCANEVKIPKMVHVAPIPDIAFSLPSDVCLEPGVNELSYAGVIGTARDTYYWDLSQFDPSEIINDPLLTAGPFIFDLKTKPMATVGLTVKSEFGCESKPIIPIILKRNPVFSIESGITEGCIPFETELSGIVTDPVDRINFTWNFGDGTTGSGSPVSHTYTAPGKSFNVILNGKSSVTGCENTVTESNFLKTYPKPTAKFSMDNKIVYNDKPDVSFTDQSIGASAWLWDFEEGSTSTLQNLTYHFRKMGPHQITLEVSNAEGCTDEITDTVLVAFDRLFPPNGFSPNASKEIDRVFLLNSDGIAPEGYHFTVLSRWNDVVFEAKDEIKGWDGRTKSGSFAPAGAYVWILNFSDFLGRKHRQTGTVTLVY